MQLKSVRHLERLNYLKRVMTFLSLPGPIGEPRDQGAEEEALNASLRREPTAHSHTGLYDPDCEDVCTHLRRKTNRSG